MHLNVRAVIEVYSTDVGLGKLPACTYLFKVIVQVFEKKNLHQPSISEINISIR